MTSGCAYSASEFRSAGTIHKNTITSTLLYFYHRIYHTHSLVYAISTDVHIVMAVSSLPWQVSTLLYFGSSMLKKQVWLLGR